MYRSLIIVAIVAVAVLFAASCTQTGPGLMDRKWIDLSHDFSEETLYWVTAERFKRTTVAEGHTERGFFYSAYNFSGAEHGGTHIDAPVHFAEGKNTVDQIGLERLIAQGVKISVTEKAAADRDYQITTSDIEEWEARNGRLPDGAILLFETGFGAKWPDAKAYLGTDRRGDDAVKELSFPGLHPDAAKWLIANREIAAVGIDTASIDFGKSLDFGAQVALMENNIPAFENVAALEAVPETGAYIFALPMKIRGGSGAPLRIVAGVSLDRNK